LVQQFYFDNSAKSVYPLIALFAMPVYTISQLIAIKESAPLFEKPVFLVDVKDINQRYVNHHQHTQLDMDPT
jgi:hypothetical protein